MAVTHNRGTAEHHSELLLLPDGRILAHNLTPAIAKLLQCLVVPSVQHPTAPPSRFESDLNPSPTHDLSK